MLYPAELPGQKTNKQGYVSILGVVANMPVTPNLTPVVAMTHSTRANGRKKAADERLLEPCSGFPKFRGRCRWSPASNERFDFIAAMSPCVAWSIPANLTASHP